MKRNDLLEYLFDAKGISSENFLIQKLNYLHYNPVKGQWNLVKDYPEYEHSSASFYERGIIKRYEPFDFKVM